MAAAQSQTRIRSRQTHGARGRPEEEEEEGGGWDAEQLKGSTSWWYRASILRRRSQGRPLNGVRGHFDGWLVLAPPQAIRGLSQRTTADTTRTQARVESGERGRAGRLSERSMLGWQRLLVDTSTMLSRQWTSGPAAQVARQLRPASAKAIHLGRGICRGNDGLAGPLGAAGPAGRHAQLAGHCAAVSVRLDRVEPINWNVRLLDIAAREARRDHEGSRSAGAQARGYICSPAPPRYIPVMIGVRYGTKEGGGEGGMEPDVSSHSSQYSSSVLND